MRHVSRILTAAALMAAPLLSTPRALACGGFFCTSAEPVNQAAERIIFANNGDGTVTAVIQILYEGPSERFSWLLPISSVPKSDADVGVGSDSAFERLQSVTNPLFVVDTVPEGQCSSPISNSAAISAGDGTHQDAGGPPIVKVEASGMVGPFDWTVISLDASSADPAAAATAWLGDNGFDVAPNGARLLAPYLEDGLYLLALKLTKGNDAGAIRPIVLTYDAELPMIPIKLTAVAANDDMGVMTWILGDHRAVPRNYLALELNEAGLDWFDPGSSYDRLVSEAADEAGGRGFVTEFAKPSSELANAIWGESDEDTWNGFLRLRSRPKDDIFDGAVLRYADTSGFWDAVRQTVTLPDEVTFDELRDCPSCFSSQVEFVTDDLIAALEKSVLEPLRFVQRLIDDHPYTTRLYSTLSAAEMTEDPLFTFNSSLPDVDNFHYAVRTLECGDGLVGLDAPWRMTLPQGQFVRGQGLEWPLPEDLPPNARVLRVSDSGAGVVVLDNRAEIRRRISESNQDFPRAPGESSGCALSGPAPAGGGAHWLAFLAACFVRLSRRARRA